MESISSILDYSGIWEVKDAYLPNGQFAYTGTIDISRQANIYQLIWNISAGPYVGIGMVHGSHLFVSCGERFDGLGIALFFVQADGTVKIQWNTPSMKAIVGEGSFLGEWNGSFEGTHPVRLQAPGQDLSGDWSFALKKNGSVFEFQGEKSDGMKITGLGLPVEGGFAVGWYPDVNQLAFMDYKFTDPQTATALWALGGFSTLGTETLMRKP